MQLLYAFPRWDPHDSCLGPAEHWPLQGVFIWLLKFTSESVNPFFTIHSNLLVLFCFVFLRFFGPGRLGHAAHWPAARDGLTDVR